MRIPRKKKKQLRKKYGFRRKIEVVEFMSAPEASDYFKLYEHFRKQVEKQMGISAEVYAMLIDNRKDLLL